MGALPTMGHSGSYSGHGDSSYAGTAMAYADPPKEIGSVVRDGLSANEQTLSDLHETISRLEGRLEAALTPVQPQATTTSSGSPVPQPCSHVAIRIATLNDGYRHAVARLQDLIRRVEV